LGKIGGMDIHAPNGPVTTWREIFTHLGIVTVGILIALGLEGTAEWVHHRHLVKEARENLTSEIRDNRAELEKSLSDLPGSEKKVREIIDRIDGIEGSKDKNDSMEIRYSFDDANLTDSSWTTAQSTGALSYMTYGEVKKYSEVYDLQREYVELQKDLIQRIIDSNDFGKGKGSLSPVRDRMSAVDRSMLGLEQVGKSLDEKYKKF
jgi:hypothetical protein